MVGEIYPLYVLNFLELVIEINEQKQRSNETEIKEECCSHRYDVSHPVQFFNLSTNIKILQANFSWFKATALQSGSGFVNPGDHFGHQQLR